MKVLIQAGKVYSQGSLTTMDILIEGGKIQALGQHLVDQDEVDQVIDASGCLVTPGLIDIHVHYREPGFEDKETIASGSRAAARGGFTSVCTMANTNPVPDTPEKLSQLIQKNQNDGEVKIHQYAPITKDLTSDQVVDIPAMKEAGAFALSNDGHGVQSAATMYQAMLAAKEQGLAICAHLEDRSLFNNGVINAGKAAERLELPGILSVAESSQLARDIELARATGVHYHVCHVSTAASLNLIRQAKLDGVNITCEVAPHHLLFHDGNILKDDANYKMNPPLRNSSDQEALVQAINDGTIDLIATDHAPHTEEEKSQGFLKSPFGIVGSETAFMSLYTLLVKRGKLSLERLIALMTDQPRQLFHLETAGTIWPGQAADISIFNLDRPYQVKASDYASKSSNSPLNNTSLYGKTEYCLVNGEVVYQAEGGNSNE
ncbi:dihydroorotase [Aerococcus urinae]|uniref:dihydroorotase n=1 Tax=Aerococcus TaxID=1375 RepID=UPI00227C1C10|nr:MULTISPECIES: dihydroorotase [Aerococcus]MCY3035777.1 dihydroorotase [Aerococcus sp. Group 2]MCY3040445.1 dihydroorotase [Aerococcus sp. Group 2]MDK6519889.1 dihydroorotase [Aerococcus urinae]